MVIDSNFQVFLVCPMYDCPQEQCSLFVRKSDNEYNLFEKVFLNVTSYAKAVITIMLLM